MIYFYVLQFLVYFYLLYPITLVQIFRQKLKAFKKNNITGKNIFAYFFALLKSKLFSIKCNLRRTTNSVR